MPRGKARHSLRLIEATHEILAEIHPASVRAVCYRLFTLGLIGAMSKLETNRVSRQLTDARERGLIPWSWIVDETRAAERVHGWDTPVEFLEDVKQAYRRDAWTRQPERIEVWSEKGTVRGTLAPVLTDFAVTFRVMHGYASATAVHEIIAECATNRRPLTVLYVGDWDPSGLHMSEHDLPERLHGYWATYWQERGVRWWDEVGDEPVRLVRLALSDEDVADPTLPDFDAATKRGDPRWAWFTEEYGGRCWELDALHPNILRERVRAAIQARIEPVAWARTLEAEAAERHTLATVLDAWCRGEAVSQHTKGGDSR